MYYYHATDEKGFLGILRSECIKPGIGKTVYLAASQNDAIKFIAPRVPMTEDIYVFQIHLPQSKVFETFDHNHKFFGCKSFGYNGTVGSGRWTACIKFPAPGGI